MSEGARSGQALRMYKGLRFYAECLGKPTLSFCVCLISVLLTGTQALPSNMVATGHSWLLTKNVAGLN